MEESSGCCGCAFTLLVLALFLVVGCVVMIALAFA